MIRYIACAMIVVLIWGVCTIGSAGSAERVPFPGHDGNDGVFAVGEELVYNVRYGFISLGRIAVTITDVIEYPEGVRYRAKADIASYSGVPFVSLHHIYSTEMATDFYSLRFEALEKQKDSWGMMRFCFDYDSMRVTIEEGVRDQVVNIDTVKIDDYYQDGLSLLFFARGFVSSERQITIPTLINKDVVTTDFEFNGKRTSRKSKVTDYRVDVVEFSGRANFSGIFGMTGAFRGWFTNDKAAVPIEGKLRVLIGNVTVELVEWNRPGWTPPAYAGDF